jgi:phosphoribosyl 1,2-cyclic phosphodiesterase
MNIIKFLGTAGARFVVSRQLRASGGLWCTLEGRNILIDPGPGSLLRCLSSRPRLDPSKLDAIILTHKHLDHSNDINIMIEAMTEGGYKKRGSVFCPEDALENDPVILKYIRSHPEKIDVLSSNKEFILGELLFKAVGGHIHGVETYGLFFTLKNGTVSLVSDTKFFPEITEYYKSDVLIINVVFYQPRDEFDHLNIRDAETIIDAVRPKIAVLTHFGMNMIKAKPYEQAKNLTERLGIPVISACDGMTFKIDEILGPSL